MSTFQFDFIFLGNFADIDTDESDGATEKEDILLGNYGSASNPLFEGRVEVSGTDADGNNAILDNEYATKDTLSYDLGDGAQEVQLDATVSFDALVTFADGTVVKAVVPVVQDTAGNIFLLPLSLGGGDITCQPIQSLELTSVNYDAYGGFSTGIKSNYFACFATGTRIDTPHGPCPVEALAVGDLVLTLGQGAQPLVWTGKRRLDFRRGADGTQKPIEIKAGALQGGLPRARLVLSPQHRVLLCRGPQEVLGAAKGLVSLPQVRTMVGCRAVTYHALLLPAHQVIFAQGLPVESFLPGPMGLATLTPMQRLQVLSLFPGTRVGGASAYGAPARPLLSRREVAGLVARHAPAGLSGAHCLGIC